MCYVCGRPPFGQGNKLRRLMTFAWPCLMSKNCVDPTTKYHGHLLLSHIIAKFAIHKRIVLQVRAAKLSLGVEGRIELQMRAAKLSLGVEGRIVLQVRAAKLSLGVEGRIVL